LAPNAPRLERRTPPERRGPPSSYVQRPEVLDLVPTREGEVAGQPVFIHSEREGHNMRFRTLSVFAASAVFAAVSISSAATAGAGSGRPAAAGHGRAASVAPLAPEAVLWNQIGSPGTSSISSQNFEAALDPYDDAGADDFTIPTGRRWRIKGIRAVGVYVGSGPCASETVTFYRNNGPGGGPGTVIAARTGTGTDVAGTITLALSPSVNIPVAGTFWVSFVCNMDFTPGGQWYWSDRTILTGTAAKWQNPGDGFLTGCITWTDMNTCIGLAGEPDFQFALVGQAA